MRLLVVEDEKNLNKLITKKLTSEGYSVDSCFDGEEAVSFLEAACYDGVISDIMMPNMDGLELITWLRNRGDHTPFLFLPARDSVDDRVAGLDLGASDYLVKPFAFAELMARVRAMTRKAAGNSHNVYTVADLVLDTGSKKVTRGGNDISLSAKEFSLLELLMRNKGIVLSRDKIENSIWNFDYEGGTNAVDVYIRYLRKKVDEGYSCKLIYTVRGSGYVLREPEDA